MHFAYYIYNFRKMRYSLSQTLEHLGGGTLKHLQRKEITFITPNIFSDEDSIAYKMKKIIPSCLGCSAL